MSYKAYYRSMWENDGIYASEHAYKIVLHVECDIFVQVRIS